MTLFVLQHSLAIWVGIYPRSEGLKEQFYDRCGFERDFKQFFFSWISKKLILKELPYLAEVANCVFKMIIQNSM